MVINDKKGEEYEWNIGGRNRKETVMTNLK